MILEDSKNISEYLRIFSERLWIYFHVSQPLSTMMWAFGDAPTAQNKRFLALFKEKHNCCTYINLLRTVEYSAGYIQCFSEQNLSKSLSRIFHIT